MGTVGDSSDPLTATKVIRPHGAWSNKAGEGACLQWIKDRVNYEGHECLEWPFSKSRGHPQLGVNGKLMKGCRVMCELVHGPAPTEDHEVAHSCGHGHMACINPNHLSWKTRADNQRDRLIHGTSGRGASFRREKLTPEQVAEIRILGVLLSKEEIGRRYEVSPSNIAKILNGTRWRNVRRHISAADVQAIKELRKVKSLREVAEQFGLSISAVSRIDNGLAYSLAK